MDVLWARKIYGGDHGAASDRENIANVYSLLQNCNEGRAWLYMWDLGGDMTHVMCHAVTFWSFQRTTKYEGSRHSADVNLRISGIVHANLGFHKLILVEC